MSSNLNKRTCAGESVLVIDDEVEARDLVCRWLGGAGYTYLAASDAEGGLSLLERKPCEAVVLDIAMPGESGLNLLPRIRAIAPDTAVIMLSGLADAPTAIEALTGGACGYLIKPVGRDDLLRLLAQSLNRRLAIIGQRQRVSRLEQLVLEQATFVRSAQEEAIHRLVTASMFRDEETGAHLKRTGLYCQVLATAVGWPAAQVDLLRLAAPLHDIGKIGVPDAVLRKPGQLSDDEYAIMKAHVVIGHQMLEGSQWPVLQLAQEIAMFHHEWWNGGGYPHGLSGETIPECARIVAIVDVYDALTHDRVYRPALEEAEAMQIMRDRKGTQFEPALYELFCSVLPEMRLIGAAHPDVPWAPANTPLHEDPRSAAACLESFA